MLSLFLSPPFAKIILSLGYLPLSSINALEALSGIIGNNKKTLRFPFEQLPIIYADKSINDTFLTGEVAINFELSGVDTGNSNFWLGPIPDN